MALIQFWDLRTKSCSACDLGRLLEIPKSKGPKVEFVWDVGTKRLRFDTQPPAFELRKLWLPGVILKKSGIEDALKLVSFDMSNLDLPDKSLFDKVADEPVQAAFGIRPAQDEEQRDSAWLRWVKLFSIILVPAIVLGVVFALGDYVRQYTGTTQFRRAVARGFVQLDTWNYMRTRFLLGSCVGAAFGLAYHILRRIR